MAFEVNDIVITFNKVHLIVDKTYDDWWKNYRYKTIEYGYMNGSIFVLTMKNSSIQPGTDGLKDAKLGKVKLFDYIFTKCQKVIEV